MRCIFSSEGLFHRDVLEKEEVDSVAALLGDLVAYRAEGPSHLEFLAGASSVVFFLYF